MSSFGRLYLLPVPISDESPDKYIPSYNFSVVNRLRNFIAEDLKTARKFLKDSGYENISAAEINLLNEHTDKADLAGLLLPLVQGKDVGLMSDAGCPGIADPGAEVVRLAHQKGVEVIPLAGPSSIVLSIMASGFNGQNFAFTGYLPIEKPQRIKRIRELEQLAFKQRQAQFFIETPYRNTQLLDLLLEVLSPQTLLFIGKDITSSAQLIISKSIAEWKRSALPAVNKVPVVYGIFK